VGIPQVYFIFPTKNQPQRNKNLLLNRNQAWQSLFGKVVVIFICSFAAAAYKFLLFYPILNTFFIILLKNLGNLTTTIFIITLPPH